MLLSGVDGCLDARLDLRARCLVPQAAPLPRRRPCGRLAPVLLKGRQGTELELRIAGYQFPHEQFDPWDSNWLLVSIRVVAPQGTWEVVDPSLTTWEAHQVVHWLAAL